MPLKQVGVELGWGPVKLVGIWQPDKAERDAAWELYVELMTRVSVAQLEHDGILREALTSLYQLFGSTREILRKYGPGVARTSSKPGQIRFGYLAIWMLNAVLRPALSRWHPELARWEAARRANVSSSEHEEAWHLNRALRDELEEVRKFLLKYAEVLAVVCDAPALIEAMRAIDSSRAVSVSNTN